MSEPPQKWKLLASELAFDHRWYKIRRDRVELPNGRVIDDYFVSLRPDIALILPLTRAEEVVFVQQYRHGAGEILLELPAGTFDPRQESPEAAVLRELQEETGYRAEKIAHLGVLYDNPVKETNKIHLFLAWDLADRGEQTLDDTEDITVVLVPLTQVVERINQGAICVSGTIAALFLGLQYIQAHRLLSHP